MVEEISTLRTVRLDTVITTQTSDAIRWNRINHLRARADQLMRLGPETATQMLRDGITRLPVTRTCYVTSDGLAIVIIV